MNRETIERLAAINQRFYRERADEFDATRERPWQGWAVLFEKIASKLPEAPRALDIGCGNGRFARFLSQWRGAAFSYRGIDSSALALEHARGRIGHLPDVRLYEHDFITATTPLLDSVVAERFDLVVLFGVMHHVPGRVQRKRLVEAAAEVLAPGGLLIYAVWRFDRFPRFVSKLVPWERYLATPGESVEIDELEDGDHIMTWGAAQPAYRYCHAMSDEEAETLASSLPLERVTMFLGDGDKNAYYVLTRVD